jgi:plasmid stabilization system protein ParE
MKVRWSEAALAEIDSIFTYIYERNRSAASAVVERIEGLTICSKNFLFSGTSRTKPGPNAVRRALTIRDFLRD